MQQLLDSAKYVSKQYLPFSVRNMAEQSKRGAGLKTQVGTFFGVTPAPSYINNSAAVNQAIEYQRANRGQGTRTKAQAEASERRRELADKLRKGEQVDLSGLSPRDAKSIKQSAKESKLVRSSKSLPNRATA